MTCVWSSRHRSGRCVPVCVCVRVHCTHAEPGLGGCLPSAQQGPVELEKCVWPTITCRSHTRAEEEQTPGPATLHPVPPFRLGMPAPSGLRISGDYSFGFSTGCKYKCASQNDLASGHVPMRGPPPASGPGLHRPPHKAGGRGATDVHSSIWRLEV